MKIDFHVHLFPDALAVKTIEKLARASQETNTATRRIIPMARCGERWKRWMFGAWIVL